MDAGSTITTETAVALVTAIGELSLLFKLPAGEFKVTAFHSGGILKGRLSQGLTVSAVTDGDHFRVCNRFPSDFAAMVGSVNNHYRGTSLLIGHFFVVWRMPYYLPWPKIKATNVRTSYNRGR